MTSARRRFKLLALAIAVLAGGWVQVASSKEFLSAYTAEDRSTLVSLKMPTGQIFRMSGPAPASARVIIVNGRWRHAPFPPTKETVYVAPGSSRIGVEVWSYRLADEPKQGFACVNVELRPATTYEFSAASESGNLRLRVTEVFGDLREEVASVLVAPTSPSKTVQNCP